MTKAEFAEEPSREYPIAQSYVDTFLSGCFELEEKFKIKDFAKECVLSTEGWDAPWVIKSLQVIFNRIINNFYDPR